MPELPEVETVRRSLIKRIKEKTIEDIHIFYSKIVRTPSDVEQFILMLKGQTLQDIGRKGKYLLFYYDDLVLVSHLRMEGKYIVFENGEPRDYDKHTHIVFDFTDGSSLAYRDVRKFGTMDLMPLGAVKDFPSLKKLGQEPIAEDFDYTLFATRVRKSNAPIKQLLLNQEVISGLGNIYVDDSLALSKIHPLQLASSLTDKQLKSLVNSIKKVLLQAIDKGGASIRSFESLYGRGSMQEHLFVYGRKGKPCRYCGTPIEKIKVGGRGTHYCPKCQTTD